MMGNLKFGPWLLEQQGRQDTTGTLARAWRALKDARGYNRHTTVKAIRELLSASLGEDWQALRGDESIAAAEAEWKTSGSGQLTITGPGGSIDYDPEQVHTAPLLPEQQAAMAPAPPMAVLWVGDNRYELTPGKTYTLSLGPVLREGDVDETVRDQVQTQNYAAQAEAADAMLADGRLNWAALYGMADHSVPDGMEIVDSGWAE